MNRVVRVTQALLLFTLGACTPGVATSNATSGIGGGDVTSTTAASSTSTSASASAGTGGCGQSGSSCCVASARIDQNASQSYLEAWPDEHALVVAADVGSIEKVDACTMTLLPPHATVGSSFIRGVARLGSNVAIGDSGNGANAVAFFDAATFQPKGGIDIPAADGGLWDGASDGSALWLAFDATSFGGVLFRATAATTAGCELKLGLTSGTLGRAIAFYDGQPVVGVHGTTSRIATIPGCDVSQCACGAPILSSPLPSGFDPWSIAVNGTKAYVVGISGLTFDTGAGSLLRVDLPSGVVEASLTWDPTTGSTHALDGFSSVVIVGNSLIVVGGTGVSFTGGSAGMPLVLSSGSAVALTYPLDFGSTTSPTQMVSLAPGISWRVATDGTSIYATGVGVGANPSGFVTKCTTDLQCAP